MSEKINSQLKKITTLFEVLVKPQELFDAVTQAEARLTDIGLEIKKADKDKVAAYLELETVKNEVENEIKALQAKAKGQKTRTDKAQVEADHKVAVAWEEHRKVMAKIEKEEKEGWERVNILEEREKALAMSVKELQEKHQAALDKLAALKEAI